MAHDLRNRIRKCGHCKKFEAAPPIAPLKPLACSGLGELLHVDFTSIEETVPLHQEPVIRNVMVMQDHFSKYVIAYVVKDQTACTATEMLRNGYFGLFSAPAYLVSDQGCKQLKSNYANCWKLVFSSGYAGCFLPCLLVLLFLRVGSLRLFWGDGCERLCALRPLLGSYVHQESI